ncbi:hypothetical protein T459_29671 [Capsicum annuum]|uniref:Uncharacterized protein n=1 Tax=Capsicum annuum TaxID=4072 RepID=A0A2G2Y651_CAPAN|nr:hypothetical protein T459_29671 [Capsicum annuum]
MDDFSNICSDDVFGDDCVTSPNPSSVLKSLNLSLDNSMTQATNKDPSAKLLENVESFQNVSTTDMVTEANDNRPYNVSKNMVRPLQQIAPNFEPQKAISAFKLSYVSGLWRTLCEYFFKKHGDYDVEKVSSSQKITRDAHQELLSIAQQRLHAANEIDQRLGELQKILERAEKELEA